jgi:hypothetical protein
MNSKTGSLAFVLVLSLLCEITAALAQQAPPSPADTPLPSLPPGSVISTSRNTVACSESDCTMSAAQARAIALALARYKSDMPKAVGESLEIGIDHDHIVVTVFPDPPGTIPSFQPPGSSRMAMTYEFDRSGNTLVRATPNR